MKQSLLQNITQVILIVFSVVLGLYLSERIEESKNEKDAKLLLSKIKSELNENKKILDQWVPYHEQMLKKLDSLSNDEMFIEDFINDNMTLIKALFTRQTIMGELPANDAWDIAKSHPLIVNFDYDELLIMSKTYKQQEVTYESFPKQFEHIISTDFNKREKVRANLQLFKNQLLDFISREQQLISYYNQAEEILKYQNY